MQQTTPQQPHGVPATQQPSHANHPNPLPVQPMVPHHEYGQMQAPQQGQQMYAPQPAPVNVVVQNTIGVQPQSGLVRAGNRSKVTAALLCFFLGGLGVHKFYLGRGGAGVMYLLFFWSFIPAILALVDLVVLITKSDHEFDLTYNTRLA